jgi:hypothetical protein
MVFPSSLLEEEDEVLSVGILSDQPFARVPCDTLYRGGQGYNGHIDQVTPATVQTGQADEGRDP